MKKYTPLLFLFFWANVLIAHTINYDHVVLRHWVIEKENRTIDGSFFMYKNGVVVIEDANNRLIQYPLSYFSKNDQTFALQKAAWVQELNTQKAEPLSEPFKDPQLFDYKFLILAFIITTLAFYFFKIAARKKRRFLIPILAVGVTMVLFSFTSKVIQVFQSITNPLSVDSAFAPFKPNVFTRWDNNYFYVESKGIPTTHPMMSGITAWQQQVPIPQCYIGNNAWSIPLNPVLASTPVPVSPSHFTRGAIAVAVNGIAIFNPYTNTGVDAYLTGQLDNWGGHCGRADDYHYHIAPMSLYNFTAPTLPIAFALDGFAVYGNVEPDGSAMAPLDTNNGHFGSNGVYHYHGVSGAPYMIANMVGQVTEDTTHQIIPQPHANPIRPAQNPLQNAVITNCQPNAAGNGYSLTYTVGGNTDSTVYDWASNPVYQFHYYTAAGNFDSTFNGFVQCQVPTSISDINVTSDDVMLFPNPSHDYFTLHLSDNISEKDIREISLYDMKGNLVLKTDHYAQNISVKDLAKGVYVAKIRVKENQFSRKLTVQ